MSAHPLPLVLHGAAGRMGREVAAAARDEPGVAIALALDAAGHPDLGRPLVDARGRSGPPDLSCSLSAAPAGAVVIDFSTPAALRALIEALLADPRPLVSGTTGIGPDEESMLDDLACRAPVIHAPNMSVGVAAVRAAAAMLTRALGDGFDVEIVEIHHSAKKDAPSGTALSLARSVAAAAGSGGRLVCRAPTAGPGDGAACGAGAVALAASPRVPGEIGVAVLRGGGVVGDHTVFFLGADERVEVTHRALGRGLFARGAIRAARWLASRPPGRRTIDAVIGIDAG